MNELLPKKEEKGLPEQLPIEPQANMPANEKLVALLYSRRQKLESIKEFIPLKTYYLILEKLQREEAEIMAKATKQQKQAELEATPQILQKIYFEKRSLKIKSIRID